jgi:hypothetical protein
LLVLEHWLLIADADSPQNVDEFLLASTFNQISHELVDRDFLDPGLQNGPIVVNQLG